MRAVTRRSCQPDWISTLSHMRIRQINRLMLHCATALAPPVHVQFDIYEINGSTHMIPRAFKILHDYLENILVMYISAEILLELCHV